MLVGAYATALLPWLLGPLSAWLLLPWLTTPLAGRLERTVRTHDDGPTLNDALAGTGQLEFAFCVLLAIGLLLS
jgi:1,4-dihydroxy-2-naphthoate octaprenyltransferase